MAVPVGAGPEGAEGTGRELEAEQEAEQRTEDKLRARHHDLCLAHLGLGLLQACCLLLPDGPSLLLALPPLLALPATLSALSAGLRRQPRPLAALRPVLLLLCVLPTLLSLLQQLGALLHPAPGPRPLLLGLPLPLHRAVLALLTLGLHAAQLATARTLAALWGKED
jgi:hypothetical protein